MAAKSQVLMQLRSRNSRIKLRGSRGHKPDSGPIKKKKRLPPPKAAAKRTRRVIQSRNSPVSYNLITDKDLIKKFNEDNKAVIILDKVTFPPPRAAIPNEIPPQNIPPLQEEQAEPADEVVIQQVVVEEPADEVIIQQVVVEPPTRDDVIDRLICEAIPEVITESSNRAILIIASEALTEIKAELKLVIEGLNYAFEKTLDRVIAECALEMLNEPAILQAITLPSSLSNEDHHLISKDDISLELFSSEEDDRLNSLIQILMEGDATKIKDIQVRSTSQLSRPSEDDDDDEEEEDTQPNDCSVLDKDKSISLPTARDLPIPPPNLTNQYTIPYISTSPEFTYCCNPPEPPANMFLTHKGHEIPLLSLQVLRAFVVRPKPPELITIEDRSTSPSPQISPPLAAAPAVLPLLGCGPSFYHPATPVLHPAPSTSSSRGPGRPTSTLRGPGRPTSSLRGPGRPTGSTSLSRGPRPSTLSLRGPGRPTGSFSLSRGPAPSVSLPSASESESDPDYDPTSKPKPKKRRRFKNFKRRNFQ